jgi:single-strand DNA-binding protein
VLTNKNKLTLFGSSELQSLPYSAFYFLPDSAGIPVTAFGKLAEIVEKYISKGSQIFIKGQFKTDKYTDKNGVDKYSTKIYAESIQMLGGKVESKPEVKETPAITNIDDDIPF